MPRLISIDLETTGLDLARDEIVELGLTEFSIGERGRLDVPFVYTKRFKPRVEISPEVAAIHGITNEDVAGCPEFEEHAHEIQELIDFAILVGYNHRRFDVPILDRQLREADCAGIDLERVREIDVLRVWHKLHPRTLEEAVRVFAPNSELDVEHFHGAEQDTLAVAVVTHAMIVGRDLDLDQLEALSRDEDEVDRHGKFKLRDDGVVIFNFGKHKGKPALSDEGYLKWMLTADFPPSVKKAIREMLFQPSIL